jgi:hypothetical protein
MWNRSGLLLPLFGLLTAIVIAVSLTACYVPPSASRYRHVFCLGDPYYGTGGFQWDGTRTRWARQYGTEPSPKASMVAFDNSVDVMKIVGCNTVRATIQPHDPTTNNGTVQRAQLISGDREQALAHAPSFGAVRGQTWYYGWAFSTNADYQVQNSATWPQFNVIMSWHGTDGAPYFAGTGTLISTLNQWHNGTTFPYADGRPRLMFDSLGTDCSGTRRQWHFHDPAPFRPGHRYVIQQKIKWGDSRDGGMAIWVDGRQVVPWTTGLSNMACGYGLYPVFENYRPANGRIGNIIRRTNSVYYGGLVKGISLADVTIP